MSTQADLDKVMQDFTVPPGVDARECFDRLTAALVVEMLTRHGVTDPEMLFSGDLDDTP